MKVKIKSMVVAACAAVLAAAGLSFFFVALPHLEGVAPVIDTDRLPAAIGKQGQLDVRVTDPQSGLHKVWVAVMQNGKETVLADRIYPDLPRPPEVSMTLPVEPSKIGLGEGKALLRVSARDGSWRRWFNGNPAYAEKEIWIDTVPPEITVATRTHNITQGGSGLVIYRISEPCPVNGVQIGERFYPGYPGDFKDPLVYMAMVALENGQDTDAVSFVRAEDRAGNKGRAGFYYHFRKKNFRSDTIRLSDGFLNSKMPEFDVAVPAGTADTNLARFLLINRDQRAADYRRIQAVVGKSENVLYWSGAFLRLPNAAPRAGFADHRTYVYGDETVDEQDHLGVDLASLANSPVPAANRGRVVFVDTLGIYGKTVIIDHGFGLFSMYSHLSRTGVPTGQIVSAGETIGETGSTGLAAGDHLHFSMLVSGIFVNPVEWWDASWIRNNISAKIDETRARFE